MDLKKICAAALALSVTAATLPVQAAPLLRIDPGASPSSDIIQIQDRRCPPQGCRPGDRPGRPNHGGPNHGGPNRPGPGPGWGGPGHGGPGHGGPGYRPRPPGPGYWNGHHGHRGPRPGYRRHSDGWWYPMAAFGVGALIGGAIASQPREVAPPHLSTSHLRWCEDRYRSYRASDNTFQPYQGPRQQCFSPFN
ncbi:BA14K family protein [Kaistia adipata]|uniref:BA14K family protein n=1 Tax=Kaistia adipata TaxID=166954 RepID=UPI00040A788A|nr:BA14K family protein [Kaistia adipata]